MKTLTGTAVAAVVVITGLAGSGCGLNSTTHHEERGYEVPQAASSLKVKADVGHLEVVGTDSGPVLVNERLSFKTDRDKPKSFHKVENGTLSLGYKCGHVIGFSACGVAYRIKVPRGINVELTTDSGPLVVSGLRGTVELNSDAGTIKADDLSVTRLSARTDSGTILVSGRADNAELRSDAGFITTPGLKTTNLVARTDSGKVGLTLTSAPSTVDISSDAGFVRLSVPSPPEYDIDLTSDAGRKKIAPEVRTASTAGATIKIRTDSGSISVERS